jgi:hypothetical protein
MILIIEGSGHDPQHLTVFNTRREPARNALRQLVIEDMAMDAVMITANPGQVQTQLPGFCGSEYRRYEGDFAELQVFYQLALVYVYAQNVHSYTTEENARAHQSMRNVTGGSGTLRLQDHITHFVRGHNAVMSAIISVLVSAFNRTHGQDYERELLQLTPEVLLDLLIAVKLDHMGLDSALSAVR